MLVSVHFLIVDRSSFAASICSSKRRSVSGWPVSSMARWPGVSLGAGQLDGKEAGQEGRTVVAQRPVDRSRGIGGDR